MPIPIFYEIVPSANIDLGTRVKTDIPCLLEIF